MKYNGAMIGSDQPKVLGEFYTKVLGEPGFQQDDWWGWRSPANIMIGGHSEVHGQNEAPARIMLVVEVDDVKSAYEEILTFGAKSVAEPYKPQDDQDMWLATVADPDGNYIQLTQPWE